jgi:autotransporter passenger strand-loop-strand repeat protein
VETVTAGGTVINPLVSGGANLIVSSGGTVSGAVVESGGLLEFFGGALLSGATTISTGGAIGSGYTFSVFSGQTSNGILVFSGGTLDVLSGGTTSSTTVSSGGVEIVSSGGALICGCRDDVGVPAPPRRRTSHAELDLLIAELVLDAGSLCPHVTDQMHRRHGPTIAVSSRISFATLGLCQRNIVSVQ